MRLMRVSGALAAVMALAPGLRAEASDVVSVGQAIERAAFDRLGAGVLDVEVGAVVTKVEPHPALVAVPDPSGYVGRTVRFALTVNGRRQGVAFAAVRVRARVARVVKPVERDQRIEPDAIALVEEDVEGVRFGRLPQLDDIVGARARRSLEPGVVVTRDMIAAPPAVQNGERVTVGVTIGRVYVTGEGVASGSGRVGDVVHVKQSGRRGMLRARVMERGVVEVMP